MSANNKNNKEKKPKKEINKNEKEIQQLQNKIQKDLKYLKRLNIVLENHINTMLNRQKIIDKITLESTDNFVSNISLTISEKIEEINNYFGDTSIRSLKTIIQRYENEFNQIIKN